MSNELTNVVNCGYPKLIVLHPFDASVSAVLANCTREDVERAQTDIAKAEDDEVHYGEAVTLLGLSFDDDFGGDTWPLGSTILEALLVKRGAVRVEFEEVIL